MALATSILVSCLAPAWGQAAKKPTFEEVTAITQHELARREGYQPGDLITTKDVRRMLKALRGGGWTPQDYKKILEESLPADAKLVSILSTRAGTSFMRKVKDDELIFDRMDRISEVSGGPRMLQDIAKLPDGDKLAKMKRPHGVPGFLDLLPKNASGKVRSIKNYDEPTGRIYTETQLLERLQLSYQGPVPPK